MLVADKVDAELVAEYPQGDECEYASNKSAQCTVPDAAQDEGPRNERGFGSHQPHGGDGFAAAVDGNADETTDKDDSDEQEQRHKDDEEPREFEEHFAEFVDDVLLEGYSGDEIVLAHLLTELVKCLTAVVGQEGDVKVDHQ